MERYGAILLVVHNLYRYPLRVAVWGVYPLGIPHTPYRLILRVNPNINPIIYIKRYGILIFPIPLDFTPHLTLLCTLLEAHILTSAADFFAVYGLEMGYK